MPATDICSLVWSAQFGCLLFEEVARERWWYGIFAMKLVLWHPSYAYIFNYSFFLAAVINAGVAGCCTGLALSFPGIWIFAHLQDKESRFDLKNGNKELENPKPKVEILGKLFWFYFP